MYYKTKIRKADIEFSKYLRKIRPYCEVAGFEDIICSPKLEVSHFYGRGHEATRFDLENCDVLCFNHHKYFHENKKDYIKFKRNKLGKRKYDLLEIRANDMRKKHKDDELILLWLKKENEKFNI